MVDYIASIRLLLAVDEQQTLLERLEPQQRAAVILALVGLGLLGVLLVVIAMLAARWARQGRLKRDSRLQGERPNTAGRNLHAPNVNYRHGETIIERPGDRDTRA